jgi:hypothetical protein
MRYFPATLFAAQGLGPDVRFSPEGRVTMVFGRKKDASD